MSAERKRMQQVASAFPAVVRCAIYTRKSTDEGLERDFNSLDAQREAAEVYIASRREQGWTALPTRYDDGGFSGKNIERPALKRLLADVTAKRIDCVVTYKLDRVSRTALDLLNLQEFLKKNDVELEFVTQPIDFKTSMGRVNATVMAACAQLEREMISERTRDKMHAARRHGKWIGGALLLGYDLAQSGRGLIVNEVEASRVREIYKLYLKLKSLAAVLDELDRRDWCMKRWTTSEGRIRGGARYRKNTLHKLLTNVTYTGRILFDGTLYDGEQPRIVDDEIWDGVQKQLTRAGRERGRNTPNKYGGLLNGLVRCESCQTSMTHTYSKKIKGIYRYYTCQVAHQRGWNHCPTRSVSAPELEGAVVDQIRGFAYQPEVLADVLQCLEKDRPALAPIADPEDVRQALKNFDPLWEQLTVPEKVRFLKGLIAQVRYNGPTGRVTVGFHSEGIRALCQRIGHGRE